MTDAIARKHAHDVAELISCYAAPLVRRAAQQAPHGRGRRSRLRRAIDACRFFDDTRASRLDDPRAEVCLRDAREALEALCEALRTTEPWDALGRRVLRAAAQDLDVLEDKAWRTIAVNALTTVVNEVAPLPPVPVEDDLDELVVEEVPVEPPPPPKLEPAKPSPKPPKPEPVASYNWEDSSKHVTLAADLTKDANLTSAEFTSTSFRVVAKSCEGARELCMTSLWAAINSSESRASVNGGKLVVTLRKKEEGAWPRLTKGATTPEPSADEDPLMRRAVEADARTLRKRRAMNEVLGTEACAAAEAIYKMLRARAPFAKIASALSKAPDNVCECRLQSHGTLLHTACDERRSDVVKVLLGTSDVDARNARLFTPLHLCAGALASLPRPSPKDAETAALCVNLLIKHGANPNLLDDAGRAPLHLACLQTGTLKIVEALIEGGADPTQQTTDGWLAVDAAHTVGALTDELRRLLTKAVTLKAPEGHAFVDDVDD
ncbi:unnamed protein product [Pelagomonas calceolata]|uniref:CS domain-containing protein n=1 Tax=Pelagomonas calceolata TaxID=35677 RepID=A0A8J2X1F5_9STRA|nr:unnamed protein product [Pelagomonas calceolata]|mmetsp:Transcript_2747/g.7986  ORF Transcript_2747/g.7986 Transcript_2747/m.7986 type:complete len:492 (+) Transcript_2747:80-1555(+)